MSPTPVSTVRPDTGARRAWWLGGALVLLTGVLALASLAVGSTSMVLPCAAVRSRAADPEHRAGRDLMLGRLLSSEAGTPTAHLRVVDDVLEVSGTHAMLHLSAPVPTAIR